MIIEEWKHYRNIRIKKMATLSKTILGKTLGIEIELARDIQRGDFDWQIRYWEKKMIIENKSRIIDDTK